MHKQVWITYVYPGGGMPPDAFCLGLKQEQQMLYVTM
jgi:hypothetical protein